MIVLTLVLALLASARTYRLLVLDDISMALRNKFYSLLDKLAGPRGYFGTTPQFPRRALLARSLADGFSCPFCLGFWVSLAWVGSGLAWGETWPWLLAAGAFSANYIQAHLNSNLDA